MDKERLYRFMEEPALLTDTTASDLKAVVQAYPYFQISRLLYTKNLDMINSEQYNEELSKTAVLCADRKRLFYLIYRENYQKMFDHPKVCPSEAKDRTEELLDSFLSSLGESEIHETKLVDGTLDIVSTDYLSYLDSLGEDTSLLEPDNQKLQHHGIIDAFIEKAASAPLFTPDEKPEGEDNQQKAGEEEGGEFLTETLARIYIKQKKYSQALTIIKRLSLNFPKKSSYFADQIRFLEFLIKNERFR